MKVLREIFREYDVRGVVGRELTESLAFHLGRAAGTVVRRAGGHRLIVGRDCRLSGVGFSEALIRGLADCGCDVIDIGVTPTPVGYWAILNLHADGGIQVTGSHNPADYNGFKLTLGGRTLHGRDIQALADLIDAEDYANGQGTVECRDVVSAYIDDLARRLLPAQRRLKVVIDAGNGTGGMTSVPLFTRLGHDVIPLHCDPDGRFPHHHPDPTVEENLIELKALVAKSGADLGLSFDGDADRIGVVDRNGHVVWGDRLLILLARAVLAEVPGATIVGEVKCSKTLYDDIRHHGGRAIMWRAGHSLIKAKMKEEHALLAGEMSGHIFFAHRYYGFDDAIYSAGRLLEILSATTASVTELLSDVPNLVATPELRLDCPEALKFRLVERVRERFVEHSDQEGVRVVDTDGVRVEWQDGWGLVRCSNTQPILVLRFEAERIERLHEIQARFEREIAAARSELEV